MAQHPRHVGPVGHFVDALPMPPPAPPQIQQQIVQQARQQAQILRPVYQQYVPDENPVPQEQLLARNPVANNEDADRVLEEVLDVARDVNKRWIKDRAGYGTEFLVNFIFENENQIPLEPGTAGDNRLLDVSAISQDDSFVRRPSVALDEEGEAIREAKIEALIFFIKASDAPNIAFSPKFCDFVKQRYPAVKCSVIPLLKKLRNYHVMFAVCELMELHGLTEAVAQDLGLKFILNKDEIPWMTSEYHIKRRKNAPQPQLPNEAYTALDEIAEVLRNAMPPAEDKVTCAICYDEFRKKKALACTEDENSVKDIHYLCLECTRGNAKSLCEDGKLAEGGQGLNCVDPSCDNVIPWAIVRKLLDKKVRQVLEKRIDNEAILAIDGLENCKYCSFQMVIDSPPDVLKVFSCAKCKAEFCRLCKVDWRGHMGKRCDEMKSVQDARDEARKKLEEELAMAVMRQCHRCKVWFSKEDGCNKMTCRCGATQCYMCRAKDIHYNHFCPHMRDPSKPHECPDNCPAKCLLWVKTTDIDKAAIDRVRAAARTDRALHDIADTI